MGSGILSLLIAISSILSVCDNGEVNKIKNSNQVSVEKQEIVKNKQEVQIATVHVKSDRPELRNVPLSDELLDFIYYHTAKNDIDYAMFVALLKTESNFDSQLINYNSNGTTDSGLVQMNSVNVKRLSEVIKHKYDIDNVDLFNPYHSVLLGVEELLESREYWKDTYANGKLETAMFGSFNYGNFGYKRFVQNNGHMQTNYIKKLIKNKNLLLGE